MLKQECPAKLKKLKGYKEKPIHTKNVCNYDAEGGLTIIIVEEFCISWNIFESDIFYKF